MLTATFVMRGKRFDAVEVEFAKSEDAILHFPTTLRNGNGTLTPTYRGRRNVRVRIGRVLLEIKLEWLVVATMAATEEDTQLVLVASTMKLKMMWIWLGDRTVYHISGYRNCCLKSRSQGKTRAK